MLELMAREISHSIVKFTFPQELQVVCCTTNSDINLNINIQTKFWAFMSTTNHGQYGSHTLFHLKMNRKWKNVCLGSFWESQVLEQIVRMNHTLCDSFGQFPLGKTTSFIPTDPAIVHFHHWFWVKETRFWQKETWFWRKDTWFWRKRNLNMAKRNLILAKLNMILAKKKLDSGKKKCPIEGQ